MPAYSVIFDTHFLQSYTGKSGTRAVGTLAGESIKISNLCPYGVSVMQSGYAIDYIPAYKFLIMPMFPDLSLVLDMLPMIPYVIPTQQVSVKTFDDFLSYQMGDLLGITTQGSGDTTNIGGSITVGNTSLTVNNAAGSPLTVAGTIDIGNTPAVTVSNAVNANITSGSVNATIQNAQLNTQVVNASTSPVYGQPSYGSFDRYAIATNSTSGVYITVLSSGAGGYVKSISYVYSNPTSSTQLISLTNGGSIIWEDQLTANSNARFTLQFGSGIPNSGIQYYLSLTANVSVIVVYGQSNAPVNPYYIS